MTYGTPSVETREIIRRNFGEGVIIEDEDMPVSETADVGIIIEGALEETFAVTREMARAVVYRIYEVLTDRYKTLNIQVDAYVGSEDDREQIYSRWTEMRERQEIDRDRNSAITKEVGAD